MATRSRSTRQGKQLARSGAQVARETSQLAAIGAALPGATALTLAHRLPILYGASSASALWQTAEIWRMTLEKPLAFWQGWLRAGPWPWQLWSIWLAALQPGRSQPELALRLSAAGLGAMRRGLAPGHARVAGNARRLNRTGRPRTRPRRT